jgi:hypothetical protein
MTVHDIYHDPGHGRLAHLLLAHPAVAERVKTAEFEDDVEDLPKTAFAWPAKDLFPIHTPEHAILSFLYAKTAAARAVPPPVMAEIKTALDMYGVDPMSLEAVEEKIAELAPDECLFPEARSYPVRDAEEVKLAEQNLHQQFTRLLPVERVQAFGRLVKAAEDFGVRLQPLSYKYAGLTSTDSRSLRDALRARAGAVKDPEAKLAYMRLADSTTVSRKALRDRDIQIKLAEAIGTLDEKHGLIPFYDRALPDPMQTVFNTEKVAMGSMVDLAGVQVPVEALGSMDPKLFSDLLGPEVLREIAPNGQIEPDLAVQVLNTLPADLKRQLGQGLVQAGIGHAG